MTSNQSAIANNTRYVVRNVGFSMACLTLPDSPNTSVAVQASNCSTIATPDSWSFNLAVDGSYFIQYLQNGYYMVNDGNTTGSAVTGVETTENTSYIWNIIPSFFSWGYVILPVPVLPENPSSTNVAECLTYSEGNIVLQDYTGEGFQDWTLQKSSDVINPNF